MPNQSRLLLCRIGVVVCCLLPTVAVGGWIVQRTSGQFAIAQKAEWERELTSRLGLAVEIDAVSYPSHSLASLDNLRLLDPETRALIAEASRIEIAAADAGWEVQAWQPRIAAGRLSELLRTIDQRLLRERSTGSPLCAISARELLLADDAAGLSLLNVMARLESTEQGPAAELTFHLPTGAATGAAPARLAVVRNRQVSPPATLWQLETAGHPLPIALFAAAAPDLSRLGPNCRFDGQLAVVQSPEGVTGQWSGTLGGVDLDALVTERFPHQLSGLATINIERASLDRGKLTEIRGTIQAENGAISHSLLAATQEHLGLVVAADNASVRPGQLVAYRQLSLGFALNDRVLSLTGSADPTTAGILLANAAGPILQAPLQHATSPVSLLRALLPDNQYQVPATRQTDALVSLLPIPNVAPLQSAARPGHVPTRLAPTAASGSSQPVRQPNLR